MKPSARIERLIEERARALRADGRAYAIATVIRTVDATSAKPGAKALLDPAGAVMEGWIGGGCARGAVSRAARAALENGAPVLVSIRPEDLLAEVGVAPGDERDGVRYARNGCPSRGTLDIFVEPVAPPPELAIYGDGPVAQALADLAQRFDYRLAPWTADDAPPPPRGDAARFVVVGTQGAGDAAGLDAALKAGADYVAFVGSARKFATLTEKLRAAGADEDALAAVSAPAGLDIAAITPDEIALSILAEITARRRASQRAG